MNKYGGGGFVQLLSPDQNVTLQIIDDLYQNLWIDRATRAIFLQVNLILLIMINMNTFKKI